MYCIYGFYYELLFGEEFKYYAHIGAIAGIWLFRFWVALRIYAIGVALNSKIVL